MPLASVVPEAPMAPQAPAGLALWVNATASPTTAAPPGPVTVATTVEVLVPLAGIAEGVAVTVTAFLAAVCAIVVVPLEPVVASVAVMVHKPVVREAV